MAFSKYYLRQILLASALIAIIIAVSFGVYYFYNAQPETFNRRMEVAYFIDKSLTLSYQDIQEMDEVFIPHSPMQNINPGLGRHPVWVRLTIKKDPQQKRLYILNVQKPVDELFFYPPGKTSPIIVGRLHNNDSVPKQDFLVMKNRYSLAVSSSTETDKVYYLRLRNQALPLLISFKLYSSGGIIFDHGRSVFFFGVLVGFILLSLVSNLFFFFILTDKTYLIYTGYLLSFFILLLTYFNIVDSLFWRISGTWTEKLTLLSMGWTFFAAAIFINYFLGLDYRRPKLNTFLMGVMTIFPAMGFSIFFLKTAYLYTIFLYVSAVPVSVFYYIIILTQFNKKEVPSYFFLVGWTIMGIGIIVSITKDMGLIPFTFWTDNAIWLAMIVHVLLMLMAIADKIRSAQKAKEKAEKKISEERNRIASEIHDSVGADFSVFVQELMVWPTKKITAKEIIPRLKYYLQRLRDIVYMLNRDFDLHERLDKVIQERIDRLKKLKRYSVANHIEKCGKDLGLEKSYHLLRIFEEWSTNTIKHSHPDYLQIDLYKERNRVILEFRDNGKGLIWYPGKKLKGIQEGQGLQSITWRARSIGARIESRKETASMNLFTVSIPVKVKE